MKKRVVVFVVFVVMAFLVSSAVAAKEKKKSTKSKQSKQTKQSQKVKKAKKNKKAKKPKKANKAKKDKQITRGKASKLQPVVLNQAGEKLAVVYTKQLDALKAEIVKALPKIDERKKSFYLNACELENAAEAAFKVAKQNMGKIKKAKAIVAHAKGYWIGGAEKGIVKAKAMLKKATTEAERDAAQQELAKCQKSLAAGKVALKERRAVLEKVSLEGPKLSKELIAAKEALALAKEKATKAFNQLNLDVIFGNDKLDLKLAKYHLLSKGTPRRLAAFAQKGKAEESLLNTLMANDEMLIQMAIAGGAKDGQYGKAMMIYNDIQKASKKAQSGVLQRLALGVSLEHAMPRVQRNAVSATNAPTIIDPVNRYLHFEKAYLNNELDPGFKDLSVWDYRMVVNGEEPDEILAWGRQMLANYRPDHVSMKDYRWRYVAAVRSDVKYGSEDKKYDQDELHFFQNILMNGGVCGRRAFFGRFILRSFGVPTVARPQKGHAALAHWTPKGWVVCLGGGWGAGFAKGPEEVVRGKGKNCKDFLATTQARMTGKPYKQVWRAKTVAIVFGKDDEFWDGAADYYQRGIIEKADAKTLAAVGEDIGEANETKEKVDIIKVSVTEADRKISIGRDGTITIPAVSCSKPTKSAGKIIFMPSNLGGKQIHYSRNGGKKGFEYTFNAPKAGKYSIFARVVTPCWKQYLTVKANSGSPVDIALPFTVGMWDKTQPVEITLKKGSNVLAFSRDHENIKGVTIRDFTLKPVK